MPGRSRKPATEWIGGTVPMPTTITGEGEPYRPDMLLWVDPASEIVLGMTVGRPEELPDLAPENLAETIARPAMGPPGPPGRVRVGSEALAEPLRAAFPELEIVVGDTGVIDTVGAALVESFPDAAEGEWSWLADGLPAEAVGDLFDAMAALWQAEPWSFVTIESSLFSVTIDALGVRDAVAPVIGQMGESAGVLLFASLADHDRFALVGEALQRGDLQATLERGGEVGMPAHLGLSFDALDEVAPALLAEREAYGWTLADEEAFPSLLCFEGEPAAASARGARSRDRPGAGAGVRSGVGRGRPVRRAALPGRAARANADGGHVARERGGDAARADPERRGTRTRAPRGTRTGNAPPPTRCPSKSTA